MNTRGFKKTSLIPALAGFDLCAMALWALGLDHARGSASKKLAKKYFQQAERHYGLAQFEKALEAYKKAMSHHRHPAFIFNIAQCYRQLKNYEKASFYYKLFLSEHPNAPNKKEVESFIKAMDKKAAAARAKSF